MAVSLRVMTAGAWPDLARSIRMLVAVASYGTGNDQYLQKLISTYRSMTIDVDIVVLSNVSKNAGDGVRCLVGLPTKNPWSLPFGHKKLFAENVDRYDLFLYSEDDILVTERNIRAFLEVSQALPPDEIPGFLRIEQDADGHVNYPDWQGYFHWDCASVRSRGSMSSRTSPMNMPLATFSHDRS
ncbi:hypothetical protein ONR75_24775 [Rhodopseudomonas sp. P2A-2r]|uniref:hypothetical protein n=1 Tax=Rhodopseudomonas sp. P2A-2r TaxID=2991972 RepID=UPI002233EFA2|nr:hypothetical protein [Rhodopseudomonas sp. P2A-2r]UZE48036.1 hypothetical protein ONR75_24775 [Rhodopseudomonas sp. P2A-2r]